MSKLTFKRGDVVFLKSDIEGNFPMTVVAKVPGMDDDNDDDLYDYQVSWLTKTGHVKYNAFPAKTLRKSENIRN